jgi:hypothetical protein
MLSMIACSSTGQFCQDGSCAWAAPDRVCPPARERHQHRPAPSLDEAKAGAQLGCGGHARRDVAFRQAIDDLAREAQTTPAISSKRTATRAATSPPGAVILRTPSVS